MTCRSFFLTFLSVLLTAYCVLLAPSVHAQSAADVQAQIAAHNAQIAQLQADIANDQKQLDAIGKQKSTLQSAVNSLALSQKQLASQIQLTQAKTSAANLQLTQLSTSILDKQSRIATDEVAIARMLRDIATGDQHTFLEQFFGAPSLADAWNAAEQAGALNRALGTDIQNLSDARTQLSNNRDAVAAAKTQLVALQNQLASQMRAVAATKAAQTTLLSQTKNQESTYQKLIAQKKAAEKSFESELARLETQLDLIVHPASLPKTGTGVLSWPFSVAFMQNCANRASVFGNNFCITQYFGTTAFSTANPQVYNGSGHNAIDFGAPVGTPLYAALSGTVLGTGNTDLVKGCYSFGKWVMIKHGNGLNTLYAHLSVIDVTTGEHVSTGDILGLSGMTGYATGPHLHFGVYASEGTEIMTLKAYRGATTACANATMPVATKDAYLNPLSYL